MSGIWEEWRKGKDFKKWFRKDNLIVLILAGILLVVIALPTKDGREAEEKGLQTGNRDPVQEGAPDGTGTGDPCPEEDYAGQLEQKLRDLLSRMEGVGKVRVMITLKSSRELVVEKEQPYLRSSTNETDSQGGNRAVVQMETEENTVYRTDGSVSEPYVVKTLPPRVEGVVVVAEGAGSGTVDRNIVELVQTLFDVEAHKVKVVKMEMAE